ncbi:hypothetical protein [Effusibacillus lacus]|uniref:Uncharacterized protein n=1 Tax=Effusibacillus lacus TaxID=1348429 RepID=A0A292YP20_9BACL|nr:hypothetical protein [Effusibacillus lacus]TCS72293.1 hypothetical protein EDD64_12246 [Effusibacillus lacus]GAX90235.1 hypothetical protein EFBL_1861 [Effusibacillus lacus]
MAVTYQQAVQFMGQPVCAHCQGGVKHYGIVRKVTRDGIWLQPLPVRGALANGKEKDAKVTTADKPSSLEPESVYWGWGWAPWFFLPFLTILALTPFLWW